MYATDFVQLFILFRNFYETYEIISLTCFATGLRFKLQIILLIYIIEPVLSPFRNS